MKQVRLNRRLTLEDPSPSPDGAGGFVQNWVPLGRIWAQVNPTSAREVGDRSITRYRIFVRRAPVGAPGRPRPDQRFRDGARVYHIEAVTETPAEPRLLMCYAYEEVGG
ncbi:MAG: head-tail adaptor protein [Pseudomonadota bacterium]